MHTTAISPMRAYCVYAGTLSAIKKKKNHRPIMAKKKIKDFQMFERVCQMIQESFKDSCDTQIERNFKIPNVRGRKREIDILITGNFNGYKLKIAIECKDYTRRVGSKTVEAFQGNCQRIPQIDTKIVVSKNGFSKGAIETAEDYGIRLYQLENLELDDIKSWMILKTFSAMKSHRQVSITKVCAELKGEIEKSTEKPLIFTPQHLQGIYVKDFLLHFLEKYIPPKVIFIGSEQNEDLHLALTLYFNAGLYVSKNKIYKLKHLHLKLSHKFENIKSNVVINQYKESNPEKNLLSAATLFSEQGDIFSMVRKEKSNEIEFLFQKNEKFVSIDKIDLMNQKDERQILITKDAIIVKDKLEIMKKNS